MYNYNYVFRKLDMNIYKLHILLRIIYINLFFFNYIHKQFLDIQKYPISYLTTESGESMNISGAFELLIINSHTQ